MLMAAYTSAEDVNRQKQTPDELRGKVRKMLQWFDTQITLVTSIPLLYSHIPPEHRGLSFLFSNI